jgi:hypothetical protein
MSNDAVLIERERRGKALHAFATEADRLGPQSTLASHWKNFLEATSEVDRIRADCRAKGMVYRDPWCCKEKALGERITAEDHEW